MPKLVVSKAKPIYIYGEHNTNGDDFQERNVYKNTSARCFMSFVY